eukprot:TCALIF_13383-PA protein Name:"Similar to TY3B-I Transposon Ty3-I Gag-Pol polyprotein (Saccharomyces cerevisiae (strain ATCC 204508 / S288c))" AED:0.35 eAED:0.35 QI:0/0/0/1/1/1/3/0/263
MGLISAGDEHNRRGDEALAGLDNVAKVVEDILIYDREPGPQHEARVRKVLQRCKQAGITLGKQKFVYAQPEFPVPTNKVDVRSFCGLVQQFEAFSAEIAELATPLRSMLSPKVNFIWEGHQQKSFERLFEVLTSSRVLAQFRRGARLRLETDAAQTRGLGFALWQEEEDSKSWRLLQCGIWKQGVKHTTVDVFSRFPVSKPSSEDLEGEQDVEGYIKKIVEQKASLINFLQPAEKAEEDITLTRVRTSSEKDQVYIKLLEQVI